MTTATVTHPTIAAELAPPDAAPLVTRPVAPSRDAKPAPLVGPQAEAAVPLAYRRSDSFGRLVMALAKAQGEFQEIDKRLTAKVESRREGARGYTYQYADLSTVLAAVRPALSANGLALMQIPTVRRGAVIVTTVLAHGESQEWFEADIAVALDNLDPQAVGSATTYARRYGVMALLSVAAGEPDDDGAAATKPRQDLPAAPVGFEAWWLDIEACADNGTEALDQAWQESNGVFKNHAARNLRDQWNALKAKAAKVGRS